MYIYAISFWDSLKCNFIMNPMEIDLQIQNCPMPASCANQLRPSFLHPPARSCPAAQRSLWLMWSARHRSVDRWSLEWREHRREHIFTMHPPNKNSGRRCWKYLNVPYWIQLVGLDSSIRYVFYHVIDLLKVRSDNEIHWNCELRCSIFLRGVVTIQNPPVLFCKSNIPSISL